MRGETTKMKHIDTKATDNEQSFTRGQKVLFIPEGKVYEFGYIGGTGKAIIYEEGEQNMQDSSSVDLKNLRPIKVNSA